MTLDYVQTQRAVLLAWKAAVADAVAKGWSREETIARVRFDDAFGPVDVGQALHDGSHPEQQRRLAVGQAHGPRVREGALTRSRQPRLGAATRPPRSEATLRQLRARI